MIDGIPSPSLSSKSRLTKMTLGRPNRTRPETLLGKTQNFSSSPSQWAQQVNKGNINVHLLTHVKRPSWPCLTLVSFLHCLWSSLNVHDKLKSLMIENSITNQEQMTHIINKCKWTGTKESFFRIYRNRLQLILPNHSRCNSGQKVRHLTRLEDGGARPCCIDHGSLLLCSYNM